MKIQPCAIADLTSEDWSAWQEFRALDASLSGPHFSPEFIQLVAQSRPGIEMARFERDGRAVGFLPYRRAAAHVGDSIVGSFSEAEGVVGEPGLTLDIPALLKSCQLRRLRMLRWLACQPALVPFAAAQHANRYLDLSQGFEAYRLARRQAGVSEIQDTLRKIRKAERDLGPLRLELQSTDLRLLHQLLQWKSDQMLKRRQFNPIREKWQFDLLENLVQFRGDDLQGMLSFLYFGEHLVSGSLSLRSGSTINGWVTAYDPKFHRHSPGAQLLITLAQRAQSLGVTSIEMGCGPENYKQSFGSGYIPVVDSLVSTSRLGQTARTSVIRARAWLSESKAARPIWNYWQSLRAALAPQPASQR